MGGAIRIRIPQTIGATSLGTVVSKQRINSGVYPYVISSADPNYVELRAGFPTLAESVPMSGVVAFEL